MKKIFWLLALVVILIFGCVRIIRADCLDARLTYEDAHRAWKKVIYELAPKINAGKQLTKKENNRLVRAIQKRCVAKQIYLRCLRNQRGQQY